MQLANLKNGSMTTTVYFSKITLKLRKWKISVVEAKVLGFNLEKNLVPTKMDRLWSVFG